MLWRSSSSVAARGRQLAGERDLAFVRHRRGKRRRARRAAVLHARGASASAQAARSLVGQPGAALATAARDAAVALRGEFGEAVDRFSSIASSTPASA